jgi:hypothetical protein
MRSTFSCLLCAAAVLALVAGGAARATEPDTTPPTIRELVISPSTVDVTDGPASVEFTVLAEDDLSGVAGGGWMLEAPGGVFPMGALSLRADGRYHGTIAIPRYAHAGTWLLTYLSLYDKAGNNRGYSTADLEALGFDVSIEVTGISDTTAPILRELTLAPATVDITDGTASIELTVLAEDDLAGVGGVAAEVTSPRGTTEAGLFTRMPDGGYRSTITIPRYAHTGTWLLRLSVYDTAWNGRSYSSADLEALGFDATIEVTGLTDTTPPTLRELTVSPRVVDASGGPATVELTMTIEDDLSGPLGGGWELRAPNGAAPMGSIAAGGNGRYHATIRLPFALAGTWRLSVGVVDNAHNLRRYGSDELEALGFPSSIEVVFDATPPALSVPTDLAADATSPEGAVVTYTVSATDAVDPSPAVTCSPPSGSTFGLGDTTVECTATDASGNSASATFAVHVRNATEQLRALQETIAGYRLEHGLGADLNRYLNHAAKYVEREQIEHARQQLRQFLAAVERAAAKHPARLTPAQAAELTSAGRRILALLDPAAS